MKCGGQGGTPGPCPIGGNKPAGGGKYSHLAHLMNGTRIHSEGKSKKDAYQEAMKLRREGTYATVLKDPKSPKGRQYLVLVPDKKD